MGASRAATIGWDGQTVCGLPLTWISRISTGDAASHVGSVLIVAPVLRSTCPKLSTPVGHICTHAEQRTHSGAAIGTPLLAKFITSMPWRQTEGHTLPE